MKRAVLLAVLACATASAAQPEGYHRTQVPGKTICLAWSVREYLYNYDFAGSQKTPATNEFVAMDQAFLSWSTVAKACTDFKFTKGPSVTNPVVGYKQGATDNTNVLTFREVNCRDAIPAGDACTADDTCANKYKCWDHSDGTIALTTTTFSFKTGTIFDADVEFNASPHQDGDVFLFTTISSPPCDPARQMASCVATDVQNTLTHELGHVVGLDHVEIETSTMAPSAPLGETSKRVIDSGSQAGFCDTYPPGNPPNPCDGTGVVSRRIVAVNRGTAGLSGIGCSSSGEVLWAGLAGAALVALLRRRRKAR